MSMKSFSTLHTYDESRYTAGFESSRMDNTPTRRWIKRLLTIALLINLICGLIIMGIGIWAHESEYGSRQLSSLIGVSLYEVDSFMMIGCGAAIFIITILGLCGVCTKYKCIMGLHLCLLCFLAVSLFVAGILGYVLIGELENKVQSKLEDMALHNYGVNTKDDLVNRKLTESWDRIQQNFGCCGAFGDINSTTSWAIYKESEWFKQQTENISYVPKSCCDRAYGKYIDECTGLIDTPNAPPRHGPPVTIDMLSLNYTMYTQGCFDKLEMYLHRTGVVIGTTAIVVGIFLLVELVLAICMYRMLR